ncbi:DNA-(apurinic or apyrimidinic site) lyase 2 [Auxenochlorella protothecoides]|uniref:DNA-(apurinic or apyrimidinic site) endonuclease 2 n=1 Tax=Auxenochlorella protothecoides TaxID=3075 RepID=A0A087SEZ9_AUXPR|nr:DNA-(apurinic or apyrimidinic site) lyase 2 [Auxenochlorella protothecoides]KFM24303.1 DNA-(apurinic or apyrimidinic site) lyase 2 [Auxenochlorella protothecoides]
MPPRTLRIVSWNVNGLRACLKRTPFRDVGHLLESLGADVVCLQETKLRKSEVVRELALVPGWDAFFACTQKERGYSGTATYVRTGVALPFASEEGLTGCLGRRAGDPEGLLAFHPELEGLGLMPEELQELDGEGRCVVTDHGAFVLFNLYGPAITSSDDEAAAARFAFKLRFYAALQARWDALARAGRAVLVVGDLNICAAPLDSCEPKAYTCWSTATAARVNNHGARIDLTLASGIAVAGAGVLPGARGQGGEPASSASLGSTSSLCICGADISPHLLGSDHCPVWVELSWPEAACAVAAPPGAARHTFPDKQVTLQGWLQRGGPDRRGIDAEPAASTARAGSGGGVPKAARAPPRRKPMPDGGTRATLKAFFKPRTPGVASGDDPASTDAEAPLEGDLGGHPGTTTQPSISHPALSDLGKPGHGSAGEEHGATPPHPNRAETCLAAELAAAREAHERHLAAAKEAWSRINGRMAAPRCRHGEPAALKKANKTGENRGEEGRWFYTCARPAGPPPHGDCNFFQWVEKRGGSSGPAIEKRFKGA